jgi:two-component system cell cycle response regulator CtrA
MLTESELVLKVRLLEAENYALREEVRELRRVFADDDVPMIPGVTAKERQVFATLWKREGVVSRHQIMSALYGAIIDDAPDPKIADVFICKLRKKLGPLGITIVTVWGHGWRLEDKSAVTAPTSPAEVTQ